jgi:hypothetical protein
MEDSDKERAEFLVNLHETHCLIDRARVFVDKGSGAAKVPVNAAFFNAALEGTAVKPTGVDVTEFESLWEEHGKAAPPGLLGKKLGLQPACHLPANLA